MATVDEILNRAITVGTEKANQAAGYASSAITYASGGTNVAAPTIAFTPSAGLEPSVAIPSAAAGVDDAMYSSTYQQIVTDISTKFAAFLEDFFPADASLTDAQAWLSQALGDGGTGINRVVEDQVWQRDRERIINDGLRAEAEAVSSWAARGYPLPPGAAVAAVEAVRANTQTQIAEASRTRATQSLQWELENARLAVQQAIDYRTKAIGAAGDYVRAIALGPELATRLATSSAGAQAQLINAANGFYRSRIAVDELRLDVLKTNAGIATDTNREVVRSWDRARDNRTSAAISLAQSMGQQAASALNAVNGTAQQIRQEESS